jgi:hypothetical protein
MLFQMLDHDLGSSLAFVPRNLTLTQKSVDKKIFGA